MLDLLDLCAERCGRFETALVFVGSQLHGPLDHYPSPHLLELERSLPA